MRIATAEAAIVPASASARARRSRGRRACVAAATPIAPVRAAACSEAPGGEGLTRQRTQTLDLGRIQLREAVAERRVECRRLDRGQDARLERGHPAAQRAAHRLRQARETPSHRAVPELRVARAAPAPLLLR